MTKIPRITGNALIKYLIQNGFAISTRKGSHITLRNDHISVTVPAGNNRLKIGLLLGVLNKAEIHKEKFVGDYAGGLVK